MAFDIGPLTWVKSEIDSSLERARASLHAFVGGGAADAELKACQGNLHQAAGAVQIVGLEGVTRLFEETEALVGDLASGKCQGGADAIGALERAIAAIGKYLTELLDGQPDQPLRLFPVYRDVVRSRGAPAASEADLYFPNLALAPPPRDKPAMRLPKGQAEPHAKAQRAIYQRGFLRWLRAPMDPQAVGDMRAAVDAVEETQTVPAQRAFWWAAGAFLDALGSGDLKADAGVRQVCTRIEQQIRRLGEGSPALADRSLREVLYWIARIGPSPSSSRASAAQQAFELHGTLPDEAPEADMSQRVAVAQALREAVAGAKDAWNKYAAGAQTALAAFAQQARNIAAQVEAMRNEPLAGLAREILACAAALQSEPARMSESAAMEVGTALLVLENAIESYRTPAADFAQQANVMTARLGAAVLGRAADAALPSVPLVDEMTRRAQDKLATGTVLAEMQGNLHKIEQALDAYFRDPAKSAELSALQAVVHQVSGALAVLGEEEARGALERCAERIRAFAAGGVRPALSDFEDVAQALSGLGFYIEALKHGKADFAAAMQPLQPAVAPVAADVEEPAVASVEQGIELQKRETQTLLEALQAHPEDTGIRSELKEKLESIREDADLVADASLGRQATEALQQLDASAGPDDSQQLVRTLAALAPIPASPSEQAERLKDASEETIDQELLAIFLEEAESVLATIAENLETVRAQPASVPHLTTIRRSFHTLKGSGRMVGLGKLGDAAWAVEQVMNLWLQDERPASPELVGLIAESHQAFAEWVARLLAREPQPEPAAIIAAAERLKRGDSAVAPVPEAPPEPPAVAVPAEEAPVVIGAARLSPSLFTVFVNEARQHLETLERALAALAAGGTVNEEFVRVAHTLAGICGTAQMMPMHMLGQALEGALVQHRNREATPDGVAHALLTDAVRALKEMYAEVLARRFPAPRADVAAALESVRQPAAEPAPAPMAMPAATLDQAPAAPQAVAVSEEEELFPPERRQQRIEDEVDANLLPVFLEEAQELAPRIGELVRSWRRDPADAEHPNALQRALHTLKGSARMAGAMGLGELTHHMEARVENAIALKLAPPQLFDDLETSYDRIGQLLERLQAPAVPADPAAIEAAPGVAQAESAAEAALPRTEAGLPRAVMRVRAEVLEKLVNQAGEVAITRSRIESEVRSMKAALAELVENVGRLRHQLRDIEIQAESQMQARSREAEQKHASFDPLEFDRFTRFQELSRMMAESVNDVGTVQQTIARIVEDAETALGAQARMNRELQQDLMRVRMVPVGSIAERLHRIVRQTSKELGRRANLDLHGEGVEVDRSVLERMIGPLEHLLRNSITHGIEAPAARVAAGKAETGEIRLDVRQEGQEVTLALADDGAGLNLERIREKALAQGLLRQGETPNERVLADLIFLPGFSTAERLTAVAGRGVGMDVVKNEVSGLGGRIELTTTVGQGTRFMIRLPLTTAVTQAVLVKSGTRTCALPSVMVEQVQQMRPEQFEKIHAAGQVEWAGRRYPLAYLPDLLAEQGAGVGAGGAKKYRSVLLLRAGAESIALLVDDMIGNQEVVVKNIGPQLARVPGVTGATVLGTGEVVLILNPVQLAHRPRTAPVAGGTAMLPATPVEDTRPRIMVVDDSLTVRKITGRLLAREGYEVVTAKDGVDALEQLADLVPAVMLVDIEMPRMDGFDLTRNVRGDARLKGVPIIMITSRTADKHRSYATELGVNVYLGKPYQEDELLGHIAGFIGR